MDPWKTLTQEVGAVVEASGRMLKRKPAFTHEELTELQDALNTAAKTIQIVRDATLIER